MKPIIVWFRRDLRTADHPALWAAVQTGRPIIPVYIHSPEEENPWPPGGASRWWLHHALEALEKDLRALALENTLKSPCLLLCKGPTEERLLQIAQSTEATEVYINQSLEPDGESRDQKLHGSLGQRGLVLRRFHGNLLVPPGAVRKDDGSPYLIFTPYYRAALKKAVPKPVAAPTNLRFYDGSKGQRDTLSNLGVPLGELGLLKGLFWAKKFHKHWLGTPFWFRPQEVLERALGIVVDYVKNRDFPSISGTSRLSPLLHFGQISPRQVYHRIQELPETDHTLGYIRQLYWREFAHDQLAVHPDMDRLAIRKDFRRFPYAQDEKNLKKWQQGLTGYPIVDAAMRELWETGFMHNRCRMIVGSFLVKDLLCHWNDGAQWFWDTLVDADLANNSMGWQWIAGCGVDAAPYFRIFNPILQSQKFDPSGEYIKTYVPELRGLPAAHIHAPWSADPSVLKRANVTLDKSYPLPIVDHKKAQFLALRAYDEIKQKAD